jgi:hypothetical protein
LTALVGAEAVPEGWRRKAGLRLAVRPGLVQPVTNIVGAIRLLFCQDAPIHIGVLIDEMLRKRPLPGIFGVIGGGLLAGDGVLRIGVFDGDGRHHR